MEHCLESLAAATLLVPLLVVLVPPSQVKLQYSTTTTTPLVLVCTRRLCLCLYPLLHCQLLFSLSLTHLISISILFSRRVGPSSWFKAKLSCRSATDQNIPPHVIQITHLHHSFIPSLFLSRLTSSFNLYHSATTASICLSRISKHPLRQTARQFNYHIII